jgi:sugar phosphate isomerase/epimerase
MKTIHRRHFLLTGTGRITGLALGASASGVFLSHCTPASDPKPETTASKPGPTGYGRFTMGFQSYSLRHFSSLDELLEQAAKLSLNYVELYRGHLPTETPLPHVEQVRERLASKGLTVNAFGVEKFTEDHAANEALFKFGKALGLTCFSADPEKNAFSSLEKLVEAYDIGIAIHNHGPEDERWRRPEWILESVSDLDPRIGACADLGHYIRADVDPIEALEMLGSRVLGVHLKDFDREGNDVVLGQGRLDVAKALSKLVKIGFDGPLSLEFEGDKENPIPKMLECLSVVRGTLQSLQEA